MGIIKTARPGQGRASGKALRLQDRKDIYFLDSQVYPFYLVQVKAGKILTTIFLIGTLIVSGFEKNCEWFVVSWMWWVAGWKL